MIVLAGSRQENLLPTIAVEVGQRHPTKSARVPILRHQLAVWIQHSDLAGPPRLLLAQSHDAGRVLESRLQDGNGPRIIGWRAAVEFRQVAPRSPSPFLCSTVGIADQ